MKLWNVTACLLMMSTAGSLFASEHQTPLFTSVLSTEESQVQSREPLALTEITSMEQSNETMLNQLVVRNTHVVMLSESGVSVLERTAQGLVKRHEEFFNDLQFNGSAQLFASPDGKTLVWQSGSTFVELKINADFSASHKKLSSFSSNANITSAKTTDSFIVNLFNENKYAAYQVTDLGLVKIAELPITQEMQNGNFIYNSKDQILINSSNLWWQQSATISVFKAKDGIFTESGSHSFGMTNSIYGTIYDTDTGRLILQTYGNSHHLIQVNGTSGAIESVGTTTEQLINSNYLYDFTGVVAGDYLIANRYQTQHLLYRDGNTYHESKRLDQYTGTMTTHFNTSTGQQEYWQNTNWALQMFSMTQNEFELRQERTAKQRGLPAINRDSLVSSDDRQFALFQDNSRVILLALDSNKALTEVYNHEISATNGSIGLVNQFVKVSTGKYLIAAQSNYRVVNVDANKNVSMSAAKNYPQNNYFNNPRLKVKDDVIYLSSNGLTALQLKNDALSVIRKFDDVKLSAQEHQNIQHVVELNGDLFALIPAFGKVAKLKLQDGLLSAEKIGTMPNASAPFREGRNRIFTGQNQATVLILDENQNLRVSAFATEFYEGDLYQKRFNIARSFQTYYPAFMLNDDVTGIWQKLTLNTDCCEQGVGMQVLDGHLLTFGRGARQKLQTYKINSAPYLPKVVSPILFNQGVESEVVLADFVTDDEGQPLSYSGLSTAGFTLSTGTKLKYDGKLAGKGNVMLTVSDGELLTELKLPYQINAAPALLKPLPTVIANQNAQFMFDLNDYIEDPEGSAISFQAQNLQGIQLSKSGVVSGVASGLQSMTFVLKVTDKAGAILTTDLVIQINAAPALTGSSSLSAKVGESFAIDLNTLITDAEKHKITVTASTLPAGLSLNGVVISGKPTSSGSSNIQITATDELGARSQLTLSLAIAAEDKKSGGAIGWAWVALLLLARLRRQS